MRLQEVFYICKKVHTVWPEPIFEERKASANTSYQVLKNTDEIVAVLSELEVISSLSGTIADIRKISVYLGVLPGQASFDGGMKNTFLKQYSLLKTQVLTIVELFESMNYAQTSEGFDVKLPPQITLAELSRCTKDLDTIFSGCPFLAKAEGTIAFSAVDVGSVWLSFVIGGVAVAGILKMIADIVDKALRIRSHYLTTKEQEERVRSLNLGNEVLEQQKEINETVAKKLLDQVTNELAKDYDISEPEEIGRIKHSVDLLSQWMSKGMEIYAAIQAAPEVKAVFSPIEQQTLPMETIKLLNGGDDSTE